MLGVKHQLTHWRKVPESDAPECAGKRVRKEAGLRALYGTLSCP